MIQFDWVVAISVFLLFTAWAFGFYLQAFSPPQEDLQNSLEIISEKVLDNLSVTVHLVPLVVNVSNESVTNKVLTFEYRWPFGKNTTRILKGSLNQSCNITGNNVYWRSNLNADANHFTMKYAEESGQFCAGGFAVVNETPVILFAVEETKQISYAHIKVMNSTSYSVFKATLGISRDFNLTIENGTATLVSYGLPPPQTSNVFSRQLLRKLEETEENVTLRFLTW